MRPWTRDDTKNWIVSLEGRLDDIAHYLDLTTEWCDENFIDDERTVFMCCFLTCIWVSNLRGESISYIELMEMLGIEEAEDLDEKIYELDPEYLDLTHNELLRKAVKVLGNGWED